MLRKVFTNRMLFYYPINRTICILCIWFLFDNTICLGCPHQPSSGRASVRLRLSLFIQDHIFNICRNTGRKLMISVSPISTLFVNQCPTLMMVDVDNRNLW